MRERFTLEAAAVPPDRATVYRLQGIPEHVEPRERVRRLADGAIERYAALAEPLALCQEISREAFEPILRGEGRNAPRTPLDTIVPRAGRLALFVVTLGEAVSREIDDLFDRNEPALAHALDAVASERADRAAEMVGEHFRLRLRTEGVPESSTHVLPYSPGYCGWHVTGQRKLFEFLGPEEIGVTLNVSCLMKPLKSVSGVLVAGERDVHEFDDDFDFCDVCTTHPCRERIASLAAGRPEGERRGEARWRP
jgi:hypothetical protein